MEKIGTLNNLFSEHLRELYKAEIQQIYFLPSVLCKVENIGLQNLIYQHLKETKEQKKRIKNILEHLFIPTIGAYSEIMTEYIDEAYSLIDRSVTSKIRDAVIITSIQHIKHFEIASYGSANAYAEELGYNDIADQLYSNLEAEKKMDNLLSEIAVNLINSKTKSTLFL